MISKEQKEIIKEAIQDSMTEKYMAAYTAGLGANIGLGEKKARILARAAGCLAIRHCEEDINSDQSTFAATCQAEYDKVMIEVCSKIETIDSGLILPNHIAHN
jgi:hypothetical protein